MDSFFCFSTDSKLKSQISTWVREENTCYSTDTFSALQRKLKAAEEAILVLDLRSFGNVQKKTHFFHKLFLSHVGTLITISADSGAEAVTAGFPGLTIHLQQKEIGHLKILLKYLLPARVVSTAQAPRFIVKSELMLGLISDIEPVVNSDVHIFLTGETGSGKTELAKYIHHNSKRRLSPFMHINCAAIPETLLEAELFGYKKGAFTGAEKDVIGKFRAAGSGTILLDEIGEISRFLQAKLLRVLDDKEYYPVGGTKVEKVKARIIAATNTDIVAAVREKKFRRDLYYRLNTIEINLPPLRRRQEAIPELFDHFVQEFSRINELPAPEIHYFVYEALKNYNWPGNIRELQNLAEFIVHKRNRLIDMDTLPEHIRENPKNIIIRDAREFYTLDTVKKKYAKYIYKLCDYKKIKTAKILKIDVKTLNRLLAR